jgi:hypothetical protein
MNLRAACLVWLAVALGTGCSPTLDWREFVPAGSGIKVAFPCRPGQQARSVEIAQSQARMEMFACAAAGNTFAVAFVDLDDPARIPVALAQLRTSAQRNLGATQSTLTPWQMAGMNATPEALRLSATGRMPDGAVVQEHAAFFARGRRIYQVAVVGGAPDAQAVDVFFSSLAFPP